MSRLRPIALLYKYLAPDRIDVLQKRRIRFTPPGAFNDPFEFRPVLKTLGSDPELQHEIDIEFNKVVDAELAKIGPALSPVPKAQVDLLRANARAQMLPFFRSLEPALISRLKQKFDEEFNKHFGVLCLSELWDSILMWGHYAYSHEGFVIGFDTKHPFFNQRRSPSDEFGFLRQVRYQTSRPIVSLMSSGALEWFETKADVWAYEREWRMFLVLSQAAEVKPLGATLLHLFEFPSDCVTEVILGRKCSSATEAAVVSAVASFPNTPAIYRCGIDDADYKITRQKA
jgi:hypothetical protein